MASYFTGTDTNLHEERLTRAMRLQPFLRFVYAKVLVEKLLISGAKRKAA